MKCRIYKNEPNAAQRKALRQEVVKEFDILRQRYNEDTALQVLHILHFDFGFGKKRLQRFADKLAEMQIGQEARYELPPDETPWLCRRQLEESGINVKELIKED